MATISSDPGVSDDSSSVSSSDFDSDGDRGAKLFLFPFLCINNQKFPP